MDWRRLHAFFAVQEAGGLGEKAAQARGVQVLGFGPSASGEKQMLECRAGEAEVSGLFSSQVAAEKALFLRTLGQYPSQS